MAAFVLDTNVSQVRMWDFSERRTDTKVAKQSKHQAILARENFSLPKTLFLGGIEISGNERGEKEKERGGFQPVQPSDEGMSMSACAAAVRTALSSFALHV